MTEYEQLIQQITEGRNPAKAEPQTSDKYDELINNVAGKRQETNEAVNKQFGRGLTFGFSDYIEAFVRGESEDIPLELAYDQIQQRNQLAQRQSPGLSLATEVAGSLPTSIGLGSALVRKGVTSGTQIGAIEGGLYGLGTEGGDGALLGAGLGGAGGRLFDTLAGKTVVGKGSDDAFVEPTTFTPDSYTADDIVTEVNRANRQQVIESNRGLYDSAEAAEKQILKDQEAGVASEVVRPESREGISLTQAQKYMEENFGISPAETLDALTSKKGKSGIRWDESKPAIYKPTVAEVMEADQLFTNPAGRQQTPGAMRAWFERQFTPVTDVIRREFDPRLAAATERVWERVTRHNAMYIDRLMLPMKPVFQYTNSNVEAKKLLLDMWDRPENLNTFRNMVADDLGEEAVRVFDDWWRYSAQKNSEAKKALFKEGSEFDVNYIHTQKNGDSEGNPFAINSWRPKFSKVEPLQTRSRKLTEEMDDATIEAYQNPLLSHSKYITDQEILLESSRRYGLTPSLTEKSTEGDFFKAVQDRLVRDGWDKTKAKQAAEVLLDTYTGSKKAPPAPVRAFMNLAYAGTLGQFRSAVLNLHDIAVSMVNNGARPTMQALFNNRNTKDELGNTVREFIGEQNFGEFVRDYDMYMSDPSLLGRVAWGSRKLSDGFMAISGFRYMDELGKGVVLRSAVNSARESAKKGTFKSEWSDFFLDPGEAAIAERFLKSDMAVKDMPQRAQRAIEDMAFARLGQQQLITASGRPIGYLNNPILRPAYAMTGFAIKQMALLRRNVLDEAKKGNYDKAAAYAAKYTVYAGLGYGMINETRNAVFKGEEFEPNDILLGAVDQVAAATTLNRLGDSYSREMFLANPVEYLMTSFLPPGGLAEKLFKGEIVEAIPGIGTTINAYMEKDDAN